MNEPTPIDLALRLGLALVLGLVLGYEREQHGRAAGMRTTMLVCVASAVVMLLSQHLIWESSLGGGDWRPDPARLAAGILAGMGFLGAGVIIRQDNAIHGVTTAAVLWFSAILGMAFGSGFLWLGFSGFLIVLIALFVLPSVEARIRSDRYAHLTVQLGPAGPGADAIQATVEGLGLGAKLKPTGAELDLGARLRTLRFDVKIKNDRLAEAQGATVAALARLKGVRHVKWG